MTGPGDRRSITSDAPLLEALVDAVLADPRLLDELRRLVDQRLAKGAGTEAEWVSRAKAARLAGAGTSTIRDWQARGLISRGHRGRVNLAELRAYLAGRKGPAPKADPSPIDMRAARAAAEIRAGTRTRHLQETNP